MKATGIVRRIDDLGRVAIPKEIRRTLKIKEGDPMEIFLDTDGVCFKKYHPYNDADWEKASRIIAPIVNNYAILDGYGDLVKRHGVSVKNKEEADDNADVVIRHITINSESLAYLVVDRNEDDVNINIAEIVLRNFLAD